MKIKTLEIKNFRAIKYARLEELGSMVIICGQNGAGKSCIFDAIRLLKSSYGGYQSGEFDLWMSKFRVKQNDNNNYIHHFNNKNKEIKIICEFELSDEERSYIIDNSRDLLREKSWKNKRPDAYGWKTFHYADEDIDDSLNHQHDELMCELNSGIIRGELSISPNGNKKNTNSVVLSTIFCMYRPTHIGVINYHTSQCLYERELVNQINFTLVESQHNQTNNMLYNTRAKYSNVKSEMSAVYVKELLAEKAGIPLQDQSSLTNALQDLFTTFFSGKKFLGPQPTIDGEITFPVKIEAGEHDLDDLSSGEKEILYGYLRIQKSVPLRSIILIDEPELHLHPRLIRELPQFYKRRLGENQENQIWLVTHSDALLREIIGQKSYSIFYMDSCFNISTEQNQIKPLSATAEFYDALINLGVDITTYQPEKKIVIFEGGGDTEFDKTVVKRLFPEFEKQANLISGGNKNNVKALHEKLKTANLPKIFSVVDKDFDSNENSDNMFSWDVYHIENYLLVPKFIAQILSDLDHFGQAISEEIILDELKECAGQISDDLVKQEIIDFAKNTLIKEITTGGKKIDEIHKSIKSSVKRLNEKYEASLTEIALKKKQEEIHLKYQNNLSDDTWIKAYPGRKILARFVQKREIKFPYEEFRNLILSNMVKSNYRPPGMASIIDKINCQ